MSGLRAQKKEATRKLLQTTALSLFKKRGFFAVSMRDLATECDLSLGTFYNYFKTKEEVLTSIIEIKIHNLYLEWESKKSAKSKVSFTDFVEELFLLHINVLQEFRDHLHVLFATLHLEREGQAQAELYREELWSFVTSHSAFKFKSANDSKEASLYFWGAYLNFLIVWSNDKSVDLRTTRLYLKKLSYFMSQSFKVYLK